MNDKNSKFEARNPKQSQMAKILNSKQMILKVSVIGTLEF